MSRCIFCLSTTNPFTTREHILPESLGGGAWAVLPDGLYCDGCQNRFGSAIEQQALADYPFLNLRVLLAIPTKKRRAPWMNTWVGRIASTGVPGECVPEVDGFLGRALSEGKDISRLILPAEPLRPDMICRTLLKMGVECLADMNVSAAFDQRYDAARRFALTGEKEAAWWYLQKEDVEVLNRLLQTGWRESYAPFSLRLIYVDDGALVFVLRLFYLELIVPLEPRILPPKIEEQDQPLLRLFSV